MAFVKLDTGILDSTLWVDREQREIFITALLLAEPFELREPAAQLEVRAIKETGFVVPPGWYGIVRAAGIGIARRAMVDQELARVALEKLGSADPESRSEEFDGRRLVRVNGGFIVLNFMKYRDRDHTAAERVQRWRDRKKAGELQRNATLPARNVTQAEAEAEVEAEAESGKRRPKVKTLPTAAPPAVAKGNGKDEDPTPGSLVWTAYASAFQDRYGVMPVRNKDVNRHMKAVAEKLGVGEAPHVAAFFVRHNRGLYVSSTHATTLLLRDAEALRTEWATNTRMTDTKARHIDRGSATHDAINELIEEGKHAARQ